MASEAELRKHRCCFTGHRPEKLSRPEKALRDDLESEIRKAFVEGYSVFISGMARGVDIDAAEIVLQLREAGHPVRLICASPFPGFEESWDKEWQRRYNAVMESADLVRFVCPKYSRGCFQIRNEWMVNHSSRVIAVFNGQPSGTRNTIDYAMRQGIPVRTIRG